MSETSILKIIRAAFDAIDRICSSVTGLCRCSFAGSSHPGAT